MKSSLTSGVGEEGSSASSWDCRSRIEDAHFRAGIRMVKHRHREQLRRRDESGERREPEIQPQRGEDDEDEIGHRHRKPEGSDRSHAVDMQRQRDGRHRGFDEGADVAGVQRQIAPHAHMPLDRARHPDFEQDERDHYRVEILRPEIAVPDPADLIRRNEVHGPDNRRQYQRRSDQRPNAEQLGRHRFMRQCALEVGRDTGVRPVFRLPQRPIILLPASPVSLSIIASGAKQSIYPRVETWIASSLRSLAETLCVCRRQ